MSAAEGHVGIERLPSPTGSQISGHQAIWQPSCQSGQVFIDKFRAYVSRRAKSILLSESAYWVETRAKRSLSAFVETLEPGQLVHSSSFVV